MTTMNKVLCIIVCVSLSSCGMKTEHSSYSSTTPKENSAKDESIAAKPSVCIWKEISVRETAEEKGKYKTTIYLGEKISFLGETVADTSTAKKNQYVKIKLIDDTEGWVRQDFIAIDAAPGAIVKEAMVYKRPDIMTPSGKTFKQMNFVAIKGTQDGWTEVIGKRMGDTWFSSGWVKSEHVTNEAADVAVSVFYTKAMEITDEQKRAEAIQNILQNPDLNGSQFYAILAGTDTQQEAQQTQEGEGSAETNEQ